MAAVLPLRVVVSISISIVPMARALAFILIAPTPTAAFLVRRISWSSIPPSARCAEAACPPGSNHGQPLLNVTLNGDKFADASCPPGSDNGPPPLNVTLNGDTSTVGAGTLGDIMAGAGGKEDNAPHRSSIAVVDGLVTREGGELNARFGCDFSPLERIALTANGNLQRIFSSYYDAPVHVRVESCSRREGPRAEGDGVPRTWFTRTRHARHVIHGDAVWDRVVHIRVHNRTICKATSVIGVTSPVCIGLIEEGSVGLGQMFRYLNRLPTFSLLDAGRIAVDAPEFRGGVWRTYELRCDEMMCLIHEECLADAWDVRV